MTLPLSLMGRVGGGVVGGILLLLLALATAAQGVTGAGLGIPVTGPRGEGRFAAIIDQGVVSQHFGEHPEIYGPGGHTGVDLAAPIGTIVRSPGAGIAHNRISQAGGIYVGYGIHVVVELDSGPRLIYAHLSQQFPVDGTRVVAGEALGLVGSTGWSTGPHLHFEVRVLGTPVDPEWWLPLLLAAPSPPSPPSHRDAGPALPARSQEVTPWSIA